MVLAVGIGQLVVGADEVGVTSDEPTHTLRSQGWLDDGWYVPPFFLSDGQPLEADWATPYVYLSLIHI